MGIDVWEVVDAAATKPYGFMSFKPGPGMGGHCLPVDPVLPRLACARVRHADGVRGAGRRGQPAHAVLLRGPDLAGAQRAGQAGQGVARGDRGRVVQARRGGPARVAGAADRAAAARAGRRRQLPRRLRARAARPRAAQRVARGRRLRGDRDRPPRASTSSGSWRSRRWWWTSAGSRAASRPRTSSAYERGRGLVLGEASPCPATRSSAPTSSSTPAPCWAAGVRLGDGCVVGKPPVLGARSSAAREAPAPARARRRRGDRRGRGGARGRRAGRRLRDRRPGARARAHHDRRGRSSGARRPVENDVQRRRAREAADERLHHGLVGGRGRRVRGARGGADQRPDRRPARRGRASCAARPCGAPAASAAGRCCCPGVEVGEEAFVAAGAVVTADVPPGRW